MGNEIVTKALVLHEMPIGDYDKRLILLTKDYGKITAFAKGAKKSKSKLLAGSQVFCYGDFHIYKGKNTYNVNQVILIEPFHNLRKSIDALTYGLYILEFIEFISVENNTDHEIMKLVLKTLKQLELGHIDLELIVKIFELKAMSYMGLSPWVTNCIICNSTENLNFFNSKDGGILCDECMNDKNAILINKGTQYTLEYILEYPIEQLFKFELDHVTFDQFKLVMKQFIDYNLNKKFKTLDFLKLEY
ncbi:MAG: DNA repair protein RecO [Firmicutes bacterium HGW-Firmicutes-1]|jgi:DNA repair protein RecO (recombination protein O)|nr:MAG: DNA repair protein RecO [Firmicutes bacterium HGW-Firmicutes-1]